MGVDKGLEGAAVRGVAVGVAGALGPGGWDALRVGLDEVGGVLFVSVSRISGHMMEAYLFVGDGATLGLKGVDADVSSRLLIVPG